MVEKSAESRPAGPGAVNHAELLFYFLLPINKRADP